MLAVLSSPLCLFSDISFDTELKMLSNIRARVIRAVVCRVTEMLVFTDLQSLIAHWQARANTKRSWASHSK